VNAVPTTAPKTGETSDALRRSLVRKQAWARRAPLLPALIFTVLVTQLPFVITIWYSLNKWDFLKPNSFSFTGLSNYTKPFSDKFFREAALHTVVIVVGTVLIGTVLGTTLATLLDRKFFGQGVVRTLLITPFLIMPVAASLIWRHAMDTVHDAHHFGWAPGPVR
jgi:sorbitol/mannitol transport system permease protein